MLAPSPRRSPVLARPVAAALALLVALLLLATAVASPARAAGPPLSATTIGEDPGGAGVFRFPQAVAVDPRNGNVFVADQYSGVVQAFDAGGAPKLSFGGISMRGEAGRLGVVGGVALDRSGRVFVLDADNNRVQVFSADDGRYIGAFGADAGLKISNSSSRPDGGISSGGIAVYQAAPGRSVVVYVADSGNDRVLRWALNPSSLSAYGAPKTTEGVPGVSLKRPQGVAVNPAGDELYIPDNQNHRVLVVKSSSFAPLGVAGSYGSGLGQFKFPYDVAVDARNQLYVGDNINGRVNVFDAGTLQLAGTFGGTGYRVGLFSIVRAVASNPTDPAGGVYVADTANNRIQRLSAEGTVVGAWGVAGRGPGYFSRPRGVAIRSDGAIAVADTFAHRVALQDPDGTFTGVLGRISGLNGFAAPGNSTTNQMLLPGGVAYDTLGGTWVADTFNNRLVRFDGAGNAVAATVDGAVSRPRGVAAAPDGTVLATDSGGGRVVRISPDGSLSTVRSGLNRPAAVTVGADGTAFVASSRLIVNVATGKRVAPPDATYWDGPQGLALAPDGTLYVAELRSKAPGGSRILRGTPQADGSYAWETIAAEGRAVGEVIDPANLALSPDGRTLLVADAGNNRVQRLDAPGAGPGLRLPVSVTVAGGPTQGTVTSSPAGIDCGTDCSQLYGAGRQVTLTAKASSNARFLGWSGACAGATTAPTCTVAAGTPTNAVAAFAPVPPPPVKLSGLRLSTTRWHLARRAVRKAKTRKAKKAEPATKAALSVKLTQDARVRLYVQQSRVGRKTGSGAAATCSVVKRPDRLKASQRCQRWGTLNTQRTLRLIKGTTAVDVRPRFPRRTLKAGLYRLRAVATDQQGNVSARNSKRFRVTK